MSTRDLPIESLHPSKTNPRRHFDPKKMEELTASVRQHGVLQPILVRDRGKNHEVPTGTYEVVAGERRYRAAKAAGLSSVPCVVRELSDVAVLEIQVIENLQRDDLHPLEEAEGYRHLLATKGYTVARIAERVGRSVAYVYDREKLLALTKAVKELFLAGTITAGHAILLARLTPDQQAKAIDPSSLAVFVGEALLWNPETKDEDEAERNPYHGFKTRSVRELQAWIDEHIKFDPREADPMLFPVTSATVARAVEEAETVVPITHDHYVRPEARDGSRIVGPRSWKRADGTLGSKTCLKAVTGVLVVGPGRGEAFKVCVDKKGCATHWGQDQREAKKRAAAVASSGTTGLDRYAREQQEREREREREKARQARWEQALPAILAAVAEGVKKASTSATGPLGDALVKACEPRFTRRSASVLALVPRGKTAEDLVRFAAFAVLCGSTMDYYAHQSFPKLARSVGVDVKALLPALPKAEAKEPEVARKAKRKGKARA
jgi:ParB/RepB/Spo0J family partition protein